MDLPGPSLSLSLDALLAGVSFSALRAAQWSRLCRLIPIASSPLAGSWPVLGHFGVFRCLSVQELATEQLFELGKNLIPIGTTFSETRLSLSLLPPSLSTHSIGPSGFYKYLGIVIYHPLVQPPNKSLNAIVSQCTVSMLLRPNAPGRRLTR